MRRIMGKYLIKKLSEECNLPLLEELQKSKGLSARLIRTVIENKEFDLSSLDKRYTVKEGTIKNKDFLNLYRYAKACIQREKSPRNRNYGLKSHKLLEDYLKSINLILNN